MEDSCRPKGIADSLIDRPRKAASGDLELPGKFGKMGPLATKRSGAQFKTPAVGLSRFLDSGDQSNTVRQVQNSLTP